MATAMVRRRPHAERSGRFRLSPGDVVFCSSPMRRVGRVTCGLTSEGHTCFEAGENVTVSTSGSTTVFDDNFRCGAGNNEHSIISDEEQLSISAALFFEDADHFTLGMFNFARFPRTSLLANLQWEEVTTAAPTPFTTPSLTTVPAEATASPTPSPTCALDLFSGECGATLRL